MRPTLDTKARVPSSPASPEGFGGNTRVESLLEPEARSSPPGPDSEVAQRNAEEEAV